MIDSSARPQGGDESPLNEAADLRMELDDRTSANRKCKMNRQEQRFGQVKSRVSN